MCWGRGIWCMYVYPRFITTEFLFIFYTPPLPFHSKGLKCQWMYVRMVISWTIEPVVTKRGMVVYYYKSEFHVEKLVCCIQSQGHSKGLYNQSMTVSTILSELLTLLQPNLVLWYILICWSVVLKKKKKRDYCVQGQGLSEIQNVIEYLSG